MKLSEILSIVKNDYAVPDGVDYHSFTSDLEIQLGSPDTDIRENSMEILYKWIVKGIYTDAELLEIGNKLVTNLSKGLGEIDTDSVFLRSFSALVLGGVINADKIFSEGKVEGRNSFLTQNIFNQWLYQTIEFFIGEQDLRGYILEKKWAHSIAHCSDLFIHFSQSPLAQKDSYSKILDAIAKKFVQPANRVFNAHEERRLCRTVVAIMLRQKLSLDYYEKWLEQITMPLTKTKWYIEEPDPNTMNDRMNAQANTRLFLPTIYLMLLFDVKKVFGYVNQFKDMPEFRDSMLSLVAQVIKKLDNNGLYLQDNEE